MPVGPEGSRVDVARLEAFASGDATLVLGPELQVLGAIVGANASLVAGEFGALGRATFGEVHPDDLPSLLERLTPLLATPGATDFATARALRPSGEWLQVLFVATNCVDVEGIEGIVLRVHILGDLGSAVDSGDAAAGAAVGERQPIADIAPCGIDVRDRGGLVTYANRWLRDRFAPVGGRPDWTHFALDPDRGHELIAAAAAGEAVKEDVWIRLDDADHCYRLRAAPNWSADGVTTGVVTTLIDITPEVTSRLGLERSERLLTATLDSLAQGVLIFGLEQIITYANDAVHGHIGVPVGSLLGKPLGDEVLERLTVADDLEQAERRPPAELPHGESAEVTGQIVHYAHPDGEDRWSSISTTVIPGVDDGAASVVLIIDDITDRHQQTLALAHQAMHDSLTGLPNRSAMIEFLTGALARQHRRDAHTCGVLFCDLDGFKEVNDTRGHRTGDDVLLTVADRISRECRGADKVGRLGGDEFVVVLEELRHPVETSLVANRIIEAVGEPIVVDGRPVVLGVSIGVAVSDGNEDAEAMLSRADTALYEAKRAGRGTWRSQDGIGGADTTPS